MTNRKRVMDEAANVHHGSPSNRQSALIVSRVYEPEPSAAAFRLGALTRALDAEGCTTTVLTSRAPGARRSTKRVRRWPVLRDKSGAVRGYLQYLSFDIPAFFRVLVARRRDVIVVEPPPTTGAVVRVAAWLRRTPYVYYAADVVSAAIEGAGVPRIVVGVVRRLERFALRGAERVLAVSDAVREEVIALGADPSTAVVVGTGIDTERFSTDGGRERAPWPYFVYTGTTSEVHGAGVFIEAFVQLAQANPTARLLLFSSGTETDQLRQMAAPFADRIEFRGIVDAELLAPWIRGAAASLASVRPDAGYDFAFATKALASIACGTPVIYAGVGPMARLIDDNSLGWVTTWDPPAVAEAMAAALNASHTGPDDRLARWADEHFSLRAVGARAAELVVRKAVLGRNSNS